MGASEQLTLEEAADELGVHYMTVYRYVRTGRLEGTKNGVEWRVSARAVANLKNATPAKRGRKKKPAFSAQTERLCDRLIHGDEPGAWMLIEQSLVSGAEPADCYTQLLVPAMERIGDGWANGSITVAQEHQASAVALRLIGRLSPRFARRGRTRGTVVVGAPQGDEHGLPTAILADLLRERGFRVIDLGDNTPPESFVEVARLADRLVAIGICATTEGNQQKIKGTAKLLHDEVGAPVVIGGRAVESSDVALKLGADYWSSDAKSATDVFDSIAVGSQ